MSAGGQVDVETISQSISFVLMLCLSLKTYDKKNHQASFKYHHNTSTWGPIKAKQHFDARQLYLSDLI